MKTGNSALIDLIRREIQDRGPVSFAWFMQQALYHPDHGYYSTDRAAIGRRGDYFTNVSVGPLFGQLLAIQFAEIWQQMGKPETFWIVEQGAHHGEFARDVLELLQRQFAEFYGAARYLIVEPFPRLQQRQAQTLDEFRDRVQWRKSLDELDSFAGVHFSNELLDAMPVNLGNKLVGIDGERFIFVDSSNDRTLNQSQRDWVASVARKISRGFVLAVDYGFAGPDFRETIQVRAQHRLVDSPFDEIGNADITVHIQWSDIAKAAEENGLSVIGFTDQHHFLTGIVAKVGRGVLAGPPPAGDWGQSPMPSDLKSQRQLQTLLHPEMLGRSFQVLALSKDVEPSISLSGFKFGRDARVELGL